jgi:putative transcriptional regulator
MMAEMHTSLATRPLLAAAFLAAALLLGAAEPAPEAEPADPPAGQLLIASAAIGDPRFSHAVILLLRHDAEGAFGIVINRPLQEEPIARLLAAAEPRRGRKPAEPKEAPVHGTIRVFAGGPVQPELGFVVHSPEYHRDGTLTVPGLVAMTADIAVLRDIGHGDGPKRRFFALGYAGWGAGQLEAEIARRDWFTAAADAALIFDEDRETLWERALARRTREL